MEVGTCKIVESMKNVAAKQNSSSTWRSFCLRMSDTFYIKTLKNKPNMILAMANEQLQFLICGKVGKKVRIIACLNRFFEISK